MTDSNLSLGDARKLRPVVPPPGGPASVPSGQRAPGTTIQSNDVNNIRPVVPSGPASKSGAQLGLQVQVSAGGVTGKEKELISKLEESLEEVGIPPEVGQELKEVGVEQISETVELPQPISEATGMTYAGPTTPVSGQPTTKIKLPLTDDQIKKALHQRITDSILWLALWCLRRIQIAHARITGKEVVT